MTATASGSPWPYGPNTPAVRHFLAALAGLSGADRAQVTARYAELSSTRAWIAAERRLADAISRSGREGARDALAGPLLQLVRRPDAPTPVSEADALEALDPVSEPALAALLALLVSEVLDDATRSLLQAPFADVFSR